MLCPAGGAQDGGPGWQGRPRVRDGQAHHQAGHRRGRQGERRRQRGGLAEGRVRAGLQRLPGRDPHPRCPPPPPPPNPHTDIQLNPHHCVCKGSLGRGREP